MLDAQEPRRAAHDHVLAGALSEARNEFHKRERRRPEPWGVCWSAWVTAVAATEAERTEARAPAGLANGTGERQCCDSKEISRATIVREVMEKAITGGNFARDRKALAALARRVARGETLTRASAIVSKEFGKSARWAEDRRVARMQQVAKCLERELLMIACIKWPSPQPTKETKHEHNQIDKKRLTALL